MYVKHKGEDGDKDHIHVYIEPNRRLDKMDLTNLLKEYQLGSDKPLGVRPWRDSKEEDWILYAIHDKDYLKAKYGGGDNGEKLPYSMHEICCSELYDVETCFIRAKSKLEHSSANLSKKLQSGASATTLIAEGENPYLVTAILRTLSVTHYEEVARRASELENQLIQLTTALSSLGIDATWSDGELVIINTETGEIYIDKHKEYEDDQNYTQGFTSSRSEGS